MAIQVFPIPSTGGSSGGGTKFSLNTNSIGRAVIEQSFVAGIYTFTGPSSTYNAAFYDNTGALIGAGSLSSNGTSFAVSISAAATKLVFTSTITNAAIVVDITPLGAAKTITSTLRTSTGSFTTTQAARVFALGGGGGGAVAGGGGSGYLAVGNLAAGTYTFTVGAGGATYSNGSASSVGSITAAGGSAASGNNGGAGGSGGGGGGNGSASNLGGFGGVNGSNGNAGVNGSGGTGSGVACQGFVPAAQGGSRDVGQGGGIYGGGNGGGTAYSGGSPNATGFGGGGGGAGGPGTGFAGAILILEGY